jgi:hypothetical protein
MKFLYALPLLFGLSACSSVTDKSVQLTGEYSDHKAGLRYEVYVRVVDISEPTRLKHREEPVFLADDETKKFLIYLKQEETERSLIEAAVKKDIAAGRMLHLPQPEGLDDAVKKSPPIRLEPKEDK